MEVTIASAILVVAVVLIATERLSVDLTALGILVALMVSGILTPPEALAGFANPAPITIGALFVVSKGLLRTGALDFLTRQIENFSRGRSTMILLLTLLITGALSSFINNTPVVVLFTSIILALCGRYGLAPSRFLMPVSFVSILAGTTTLIGTSTNIVVSDLAAQLGEKPLGMFELTFLGFPIAIAGAAFLYFVSHRLLPEHRTPVFESGGRKEHHYISELMVPEKSDAIGRDPVEYLREEHPDVELFEVFHHHRVSDPLCEPMVLADGDLLLIKATANDLTHLLGGKQLVLPKGEGGTSTSPYESDAQLVELIVPPNSSLRGRRLSEVPFAQSHDTHLLGVKRQRLHYGAGELSELRLLIGDELLVQCTPDSLNVIRSSDDVIVVEDVHHAMVRRRKAPIALSIFTLMVLAATFGVADILTCSLSAAFLMLMTRCLSPVIAYGAIDAKVLLLIIGTLGLGTALQNTGAADLYAEHFLSLFSGSSPQVVMGAYIVLVSMMSHFLSNNATAVLLLPVGLSTAMALNVDPRPFVIATCFGASACFATPVGYQTNLLVYGPGNYRALDYLRLGLPLNLLVWIASAIFIPVLWPF